MSLTFDNIRDKKIKIGVIGLGYVGYPLSLVFSQAGVKVQGFDIDKSKIEMLNRGENYIKHVNRDSLLEAIEAGFSATDDFSRISECQVAIICVPTPVDAHLEPDLRFIVDTCKAIAPHLAPGTLVSLESTTWPGTTREVVQPILESEGPRRVGKDLYLCFSPEREDPGNKQFGTSSIPKLVGGINKESLHLAVAMYELAIREVVPLSNPEVAEAAKLFENIYRSVNIALVNELKVILSTMGIDVWEVISAAATKPFGFQAFWPGPGLGGHCIPIDPFYLSWKAKEYGVNTRFIELAGEINRAMPNYVVSKVQDCLNDFGKALRGAKILIFGVAYKADIDDMRESPALRLMELLEAKGAQVDYHDPYIPVIGQTRDHVHLAGRKSVDPQAGYDCFLMATKHSIFNIAEIQALGVPIVDTRNCVPRTDLVYQA